ncbi:MAG: hypothetical protein IJM47_08990 [Synergistaceae bacterium]|nr:hypothetical protein [Synergistaceae bacterium]
MYLRKDVFDAKMDRILQRLDRIDQRLDNLEKSINGLSDRLSMLSGRVEGLDARMGDMQNYIYFLIVFLGIVVGLPTVQKMYEKGKESRPTVTLEDVKRLIEENNAELRKTMQA